VPPSVKDVMVVECALFPVVEKVFAIPVYAVPAVGEYRQVAFSFVATDRVVDVVPADKVPVGDPLESTGAAVSAAVIENPIE